MTQRLARLNLLFVGIAVVLMAVAVLVFRAPIWVLVLIAVATAGVNIAVMYVVLRQGRAAVQAIGAAHPDALVMSTAVTKWDAVDRGTRARVVALVADRAGISLRDLADSEVVLLTATGILSLELGPLGRSAYRPFRIETIDHGLLELAMGQVRPDDQVGAIVALRTALGRPVG